MEVAKCMFHAPNSDMKESEFVEFNLKLLSYQIDLDSAVKRPISLFLYFK